MDPWATADPPVFLLQVLPALRTVRLTVGTAPDVVASVKMTSPTEVTVHFLRGDSPLPPLVIKIPHAVTLGSTGTVPGSGGAPLVTEAKFSMVVPHAEAFTAGELAGVSWLPGGPGGEEGMGEDAKMKGLNEVLCDTCGAGLIPPGSFKRILPLPSPFWHEVAEMWMCHEDFACASPMSKITPADLRPRVGDCLYNQHTMMMHGADSVPGALKWAPAQPSPGGMGLPGGLWRGVCCARCESRLGEGIVEASVEGGGG
ncbi:HECT-like ubiquitin-conjugating enzyme-binding-domain-containing protein, partial [Baffinella frigidus]